MWQEKSESFSLTLCLGIKDRIPDQEEFLQRVLKGACSAPANLLEGVSAAGAACWLLSWLCLSSLRAPYLNCQFNSLFKFREHCNMLLTLEFHSLLLPIYSI